MAGVRIKWISVDVALPTLGEVVLIRRPIRFAPKLPIRLGYRTKLVGTSRIVWVDAYTKRIIQTVMGWWRIRE